MPIFGPLKLLYVHHIPTSVIHSSSFFFKVVTKCKNQAKSVEEMRQMQLITLSSLLNVSWLKSGRDPSAGLGLWVEKLKPRASFLLFLLDFRGSQQRPTLLHSTALAFLACRVAEPWLCALLAPTKTRAGRLHYIVCVVWGWTWQKIQARSSLSSLRSLAVWWYNLGFGKRC